MNYELKNIAKAYKGRKVVKGISIEINQVKLLDMVYELLEKLLFLHDCWIGKAQWVAFIG